MGTVLAVLNAKGGVGKTTVAVNLAAAMAEAGRRVLLVDLDWQGSATLHLGHQPWRLAGATVYDALTGRRPAPELVLSTPWGVDLLPANEELVDAELDLIGPGGEVDHGSLRRALEPLRVTYDLVLVDCQPSYGVVVQSALVAAGAVLIPVATDYLGLRGLELLLRIVGKVQRRFNPALRVAGVVATFHDARTTLGNEALQELRRAMDQRGLRVFDTVIRRSVRLAEAPAAGKPITAYAKSDPAAEAFRELAGEIAAIC